MSGKLDKHDEDTTSRCLRWKTTAGETIVLPTIELIRFYFGTSSYLLKRVVTGQPALRKMWDSILLDPETATARMHLANAVPRRKSAAEIARIALDPHAARAAELVHRSIALAAA